MKFKISIFAVLLTANQLLNCMQEQIEGEHKKRRENNDFICTNNYTGYDKVKKLISQTICTDLVSKLEVLKASELINILIANANDAFSITLAGNTDNFNSISFTLDGTKLATYTYDTIKIWDVDTGNLIHNLTGHTVAVRSMSFSPDSKKVAICSDDNIAQIWDVDSGNLIYNLTGHTAPVWSVLFSLDGQKLATCSSDNTARIWDVDTGNLIHSLTGHDGGIYSISFSPDGKKLVTGSFDNTAKIWDVDTGNLIHTLTGHTNYINTISFSPDGKKLVTGSDDKTAKIWLVDSGELLHTLAFSGYVNSISFNQDGKKLAISSLGSIAKIWQVDSGELLHTLTAQTSVINSISFSPDGTKLVTGSFDKTAKIWEVDSGLLLYTLSGYTDYLNRVTFSPDGRKIATCSNYTAKIWDLDKIDAINFILGELNYQQLDLLELICHSFKTIKNNQFIKLSDEQKAIADSLPPCIKVPLKMVLKNQLSKAQCAKRSRNACAMHDEEGSERFVCGTCRKRFHHRSSLIMHSKKVHGR